VKLKNSKIKEKKKIIKIIEEQELTSYVSPLSIMRSHVMVIFA